MNLDINIAKRVTFEIIRESGDELTRNFNKAKIVKYKNKLDICTDMDLRIEDLLINKFTKEFPKHNIDSEETGKIDRGSEYTWILDPIDGSKHYIRKLPLFSISIALKREGSTILGVVFNPLMNELFWATSKEGAFLNKEKIEVSKTAELGESFILIDIPNRTVNRNILDFSFHTMGTLLQKAFRIRIYGVSTLALCYLAAARVDGYISLSSRTKIYDVAAGLFIAKMAKGKVTDLSSPARPLLVCSNDKIHNELLDLF